MQRKNHMYISKTKKKVLLAAMDILVLSWLKSQPLCGKDIRDIIRKKFGLNIGPGTLYPILYQLMDKDFMEVRVYHKKKLYFLTKTGKEISSRVQKNYFKMQKAINFLLKK